MCETYHHNHNPHRHDQGLAANSSTTTHEACRQYLDSLSEYVDGTLSDALCQQLEEHMETCENCRVVVNTMTKTIALYHQIPEPTMSNAVKERLYKVLHLDAFIPGGGVPPVDHAPDEPH